MEKLAKLQEIDLREVWSHEAADFTPWLIRDENIALLSEELDIDIIIDESEACVGSFKVDILAAEADTGRTVIIENQLTDTDHDHLGKLITYASGKEASIIIWIVRHAREEHRAAIEWLNRNTGNGIGFFLCEVRLYRIGDSAPAVKFDVIEKPNEWTNVQWGGAASSSATITGLPSTIMPSRTRNSQSISRRGKRNPTIGWISAQVRLPA